MSGEDRTYICSICGKVKKGWGNNSCPITFGEDDRCCDDCNFHRVIPARLEQMYSKKAVL